MNQTALIGNLTKDPDLRATSNGTSFCRFTIAVSDRKKDPKTGEWVDDTDFIPVVAWGKLADNCGRFLSKGSKCGVNGKIKTGSYTNKEGQKVYTTDVVANNVEFLNQREQEQPQQTFAQQPVQDPGPQQQTSIQQNVPAGFEQMQEEIPF